MKSVKYAVAKLIHCMIFTCYTNATGALVEILAQLEENNKGLLYTFMELSEED